MPELPPLPPELDPRGKHRRRHSAVSTPGIGWHRVLTLVRVVAAALSLFLLITFGVYWQKYHAFSAGIKRVDVFANNSTVKPKHDIDGKAQNILIVGNDDRQTATDAELAALGTGRDGGSLNTDTMMIVHVPANGAKATLISLPRDSYVNIPGYGYNKLNSAYALAYNDASGTPDAKRGAGGAKLIQVVEGLTGLTIDHYVQVDLIGFYRISEAIGPINVDMCANVQEPESGINLHKGVNSIVGKQALAFVRQRFNFPNGLGDLDRVQRQRYFLTATFRKLTSAGTLLNPGKLQKLLNAVQSSLYMDPKLNPQSLAEQMINLSADNIVGQTMPTDGFGTSADGQSILKVNPAEVKAFVAQLVGSAPAPHPSSSGSSSASSSRAPTSGSSAPTSSATKAAPIDAGCIY